ncbi:MAG TPA: cyclic dehypoxanthinyl futalosine synthase [Syntrophomonadaceae bacterium]|nr:cyclic dehypoxanthinyl futalosine synthase [Syntrophomonadaceae bacterium]
MDTQHILGQVLDGRRMNNEELAWLYQHGDLISIGQAADQVRQRRYPEGLTTYIIDRNINNTNICSCQCKFCAFFRKAGDEDAYVLDEETLFAKIEEALQLGASQLMIQGGLNEDLSLEYYENMFRSIKERYAITIHSLTAPEVVFIARNAGLSIQATLERLQAAGLDSLPGGGAEVLHDEVRKAISPNKISSREWIEVMRIAHRIGMKTTATMMMGSVDQIEHRIHHLDLLRSLQDETQGFRAFIAWTYQPGNNELLGSKISSMLYLKFLALSRLYLDNFEHIQGSWPTQGERIGQLSLFFGADDMGSIMLEENVVRSAGLTYEMHEQKMIGLIRETGRIPALRDTEYRILKRF